MADKVMSPPKKASNRTGVPIQVKSRMINGPTADEKNLLPFNRKGSKKG